MKIKLAQSYLRQKNVLTSNLLNVKINDFTRENRDGFFSVPVFLFIRKNENLKNGVKCSF